MHVYDKHQRLLGSFPATMHKIMFKVFTDKMQIHGIMTSLPSGRYLFLTHKII